MYFSAMKEKRKSLSKLLSGLGILKAGKKSNLTISHDCNTSYFLNRFKWL